jgi:tetratricopeptide (TPR) repeat protein
MDEVDDRFRRDRRRSVAAAPGKAGIVRIAIMLIVVSASISGLTIKAWNQTTEDGAASVPMQQLHKALDLAQRGDADGAMQIAQQLLDQNPKFEPAMKLKGMLLEETGRKEEAIVVYEQALKVAPNDTDLLLKDGLYKLTIGQKQAALDLLSRAAKARPTDGEVQYYLAQAYHLNGRDDLALEAVRKSMKADPYNASIKQKYGELLCSTGNNQEGLHWLAEAKQGDSRLPHIDYEIGAADYKVMDLPGAAENLRRATEVEPGDLNALQMLGATQAKLGQWAAAKDSFTKLLARRPDDVDSLLGLGQCQLELKDYSDAAATLQSVLHLDPTKLLAHFYLSRAYAGMQNSAEAAHEAALHHLMMEQMSFVRSVETEQREDAIRHPARELLQQHREEDALQLYTEHFKGTQATPGDAMVFVGKTYLFMGDTDDGLRCLHRALALDSHVRGAHSYEGILALKDGDLSRAEKEFKAELANDPSYQMAIAEMGEVRYRQENWAEAADWLNKSKTMTPELLYMLADAEFHLGKAQDANLVAETAAAYGRNNPQLIQGLEALLIKNGQGELAKKLASN